jgi:hypothetical protein
MARSSTLRIVQPEREAVAHGRPRDRAVAVDAGQLEGAHESFVNDALDRRAEAFAQVLRHGTCQRSLHFE